MSVGAGARTWAGCALALLAGVGAAVAPAPLSAQAIVGLEKAGKLGAGEPEVAIQRLRDGWRNALLVAGQGAEPEVLAEAVVRMIREPIKRIGFGSLDEEGSLALKAAVVRAEADVRAVGVAVASGALSAADAPGTAQRALDTYLSVLGARLGRAVTDPPGVGRR
jgi:hypothetical protein